jgi:hypothetical protein
MADGVQPAVTVTGDERPTAAMVDEFRLRASDGSQPQSRMEMTDGERPAAMVTGGERSAATVDDELRSTVRLPLVADGVQPAATVTDGV